MKQKNIFDIEYVEVKKIKAKLQTTSLIAFATVLLIVSTVQIAEAEPTRTISGFDANREIFIANDGINNIIILQSDTGISKHFDSEVKTYNSGGFSMKNLKSGILVFAHPISDDKYKLVVLTTDTVYRFIGVSGIIAELNEEPIPVKEVESVNATKRIEPKNSVGADITKYDIPNTLSRDGESSFLMALKPSQSYQTLQLGDKFEFDGYVYSVRNSTSIVGADISFEISRDNYILKSIETKSGQAGTIHVEIDDMIYPMFYPNFCYDVKITVNHGEYTIVWTDDFVMTHSGAWNPNMDWVAESRWNYLPQSFIDEPRVSIPTDERCN